MEIWKDIPGYEGSYQVSDLGSVRSLSRVVTDMQGIRVRKFKGRVLSPGANRQGYLNVLLCSGVKQITFDVHRLVAVSFLGPCPAGLEVCHGPGGMRDNRLVNLKYADHVSNCLDQRRDGTRPNARAVVRSDGKVFASLSEANESTGANPYCIRRACIDKHRTAGGFGWKYLEKPDA